MLTIGVLAESRKENERRKPIHPGHFDIIPDALRSGLRFETGYGEAFGTSDGAIAAQFGGVGSREELLASSDVILFPKPMPEDLREMREGGILWGWPHCVQQREMTQVAIDRRLTLLAWEASFTWQGDIRDTHTFAASNEMAGYCAVIHAMGLTGTDGCYGPPLRATVLSHGSVSHGAIHALQGRGVRDITVYTYRKAEGVRYRVPGCRYGLYDDDGSGNLITTDDHGVTRRLADVLVESDLIVNGILQDTDHPLMYLAPGDESRFKPGTLIMDVSCDEGMGFPFARPTSFKEPVFAAGPATYYAVDHTPSYLWRSATWEISAAVVPFLGTVMGGPSAWDADETIRRSIEIREGVIQNEMILRFQNRSAEYPHGPMA